MSETVMESEEEATPVPRLPLEPDIIRWYSIPPPHWVIRDIREAKEKERRWARGNKGKKHR